MKSASTQQETDPRRRLHSDVARQMNPAQLTVDTQAISSILYILHSISNWHYLYILTPGNPATIHKKTYANYKFWLLIVWVCLCSNHVTGAKIHIIRFWQRQLEIETECKKAIRCHPRSSILRQVERKREYIQQFWSIWKCSEVIATHNCKSSFSNRTVIWPRSLDNPCEYPEKLDIDWN